MLSRLPFARGCSHAWQVSEEGSRESVDAGCRRLTASWVRERASRDAAEDEEGEAQTCDFFEDLEQAGTSATVPPGVYTVRRRRASPPATSLTSPFSCKTCVPLGARSGGAPTSWRAT